MSNPKVKMSDARIPTREENMYVHYGNLALNQMSEMDCPALAIMVVGKEIYICQSKLKSMSPEQTAILLGGLKNYLENIDSITP
jgi:hypothetical protein